MKLKKLFIIKFILMRDICHNPTGIAHEDLDKVLESVNFFIKKGLKGAANTAMVEILDNLKYVNPYYALSKLSNFIDDNQSFFTKATLQKYNDVVNLFTSFMRDELSVYIPD